MGSVDPDTMQEGDGNWMHEVQLKISREASSCPAPFVRRLDQIDSTEQRPSIFMPRRQVAPPVPMVAHTPSQQQPLDHTGAAASSRGSTGGSVIVAAVGPYHKHHHRSESEPPPLITHAKKCAIVEFLARQELGLDTVAFLEWARRNDATARGCYERDSFTMGPEELAEMHLLDGCLVLFAVFLLSVREDQRPAELLDRTTDLGKEFINLSADISLHMNETRLDLLLLWNQIPFFLLADLHSRLKDTIFFRGIKRSTQQLALSCFDDVRPSPSGFIKRDGEALVFPEPVHHLLHLFHWSRVPPAAPDDAPAPPSLLGEPESNLPCATWFEDSRISLGTDAAAPGTLHMGLERKMLGARGVLRVPALHIHGYSDHVFHNLIAFEQSHLMCGLAVTTYCICMARLLQSEEDAKLLRRSGILAHTHETDKEIVALFRGLADEYRHASYSRDLLHLCNDVEAHHHSTAARAVKWVALQCFPKQTVTFFVILGALISIATLINTIVSVYRFFHPAKQ